MRTLAEVENYFTYHAPDAETRQLHENVNDLFLRVIRELWAIIPPFNSPSPDKTVMFRALSDARTATNMAIACFVPPNVPDNSAGADPSRRPHIRTLDSDPNPPGWGPSNETQI